MGLHLALIGSVNDEILISEELAISLIDILKEHYKGVLEKRYEVEETHTSLELLSEIAEHRKCLKKGGELDLSKAADILLDEYRSGRLGAITLEFCDM